MKADRLLTIKQVRELVPIAASTIYDAVAKGTFPKPLKVGKRSLWRDSDIQSFIAADDWPAVKAAALDPVASD